MLPVVAEIVGVDHEVSGVEEVLSHSGFRRIHRFLPWRRPKHTEHRALILFRLNEHRLTEATQRLRPVVRELIQMLILPAEDQLDEKM